MVTKKGPIGSTVLTFIGYKQIDKPNLYIDIFSYNKAFSIKLKKMIWTLKSCFIVVRFKEFMSTISRSFKNSSFPRSFSSRCFNTVFSRSCLRAGSVGYRPRRTVAAVSRTFLSFPVRTISRIFSEKSSEINRFKVFNLWF